MPFRPNILNTTPGGLLNPLSTSPILTARSNSSESNYFLDVDPSDSIDTTLKKLGTDCGSEKLISCGDLAHPASSLFSTPRRNKSTHTHPSGNILNLFFISSSRVSKTFKSSDFSMAGYKPNFQFWSDFDYS